MGLSVGPLRRKHYEVFYVSHVVCIIGFMVATWLHHPPLGAWMYAPLLWWAAERITRAARVAWVNGIGFAGKAPEASTGLSAAPPPFVRAHEKGMPSMAASHSPFMTPSGEQKRELYYSYNKAPLSSPLTSPPAGHYPPLLQGRPQTASSSSGRDTQHSRDSSLASASRARKEVGQLDHPLQQQQAFERERTATDAGSTFSDPLNMPPHLLYQHQQQQRFHGPQTLDPFDQEHAQPDQIDDVINAYVPRRRSEFPPEDYEGQLPGTPGAPLPNSPFGRGFQLEDNGPSNSAPGSDSDTLVRPPSSSAEHYGNGDMHGGPQYATRPQAAYPPSVASSTLNGSHHGGYYEHSKGGFSTPVPVLMPPPSPRAVVSTDIASLLRPGYAFCQLLPGQTVRLTLRTPNPIAWRPGQWVNLNVPAVRLWQSHPFTIASAYDAAEFDQPRRGRSGSTPTVLGDVEQGLQGRPTRVSKERTIVLLLRARAGFSKDLLEYVRKQRRIQLGPPLQGPSAVTPSATGIHLRAIVDGPYGSTKSVDWGAHSSVVILCAGSGISFGIGVLEHLNACIASNNRHGKDGKGGKHFKLQKIRFVWILREYSHLQWVASALIRIIQMVPPEHLHVDLYVTHFNNQSALLPQGVRASEYVGTSHSGAASIAPSEFTTVSGTTPRQARFTEGPEQEEYDLTANNVTQFEGEEDDEVHGLEAQMNDRIRKEGKMRRANTRRVTMKRKGMKDVGSKTPQVAAAASQRAVYEGWSSAGRGAPMEDLNEGVSPGPGGGSLLMPPQTRALGSFSGTSSPWSRPTTPDTISKSEGPYSTHGHPEAMRSEARLVGGDELADENSYAIDLDQREDKDLRILAELARPGHPKLDKIIREEVEASAGMTLVTCCGPASLGTVVRSIVTKAIDPARVRKGDSRGMVNVVSETFEWGS